jgi:hypothetical protein
MISDGLSVASYCPVVIRYNISFIRWRGQMTAVD